ncbi:MAG: hypothetical protein ACRET2_08995 [Steroidobacteraceae bacterium]
MSEIRVRFGPRDIKKVAVKCPQCPTYGCFWPGRVYIRSPGAGASGCSSQTTDRWSCGRRDQSGCPDEVKVTNGYRKKNGAWERVQS